MLQLQPERVDVFDGGSQGGIMAMSQLKSEFYGGAAFILSCWDALGL